MDRVLLPLRSNAGWFTDAETNAALEQRVKNYVIAFEGIAVQDGRYSATLWKSRTSFELLTPASAITFARDSVDYCPPDGEPFLLVDGHALGSGPAEASYTVDFVPLFSKAGLKDADFVEWLDGDITDDAKGRVSKLAGKLVSSDAPLPLELASMSVVRREKILAALLIDAVIADALKIPFSTDFHAAPLIAWSNAKAFERLKPGLRPDVYDQWVMLGLPDFGNSTWDEVLRVRESAAGRDYRSMLRRVENRTMAAIADGASRDDVDAEIRRGLVEELVLELRALAPSVSRATLNFGWNLVPLLGPVLGTVNDVREIIQHRQSWVSLLFPSGPPTDRVN